MTTITGTLDLPGGGHPDGVRVLVELAGDGGHPLPHGYATADGHAIVGRHTTKTVEGVWTVEDIVPNDDIAPEGTRWRITYSGDHEISREPFYVLVADSEDPVDVSTILADPPGALVPPQTAEAITAEAAARLAADAAEAAARAAADVALSTALSAEATARAAGDTAARARGNHTGTQLAATVSDFDTAAVAAGAGTYGAFVNLASDPDSIISGTITRDANDAVTSAEVLWPDGSPGSFTADTLSTAFPGAVDGYHVTYGSPVTRTYTQPTMTRNANGAVTTRPAIVVT